MENKVVQEEEYSVWQCPPREVVIDVWAENLEEEMLRLSCVLYTHRLIAVDTEFPGFVHGPGPRDTFDIQNYKALAANVNELKLIQLGLTLFDDQGRIGGCWQFNFKDFDIDKDSHVLKSIELLKRSGIDFEKNRSEGVDSDTFAKSFNALLKVHPGIWWVTFHGMYDVAYLSKLLMKKEIPNSEDEFDRMSHDALGGIVYDVKFMAEWYLGERGYGGLEKLSRTLLLQRVGAAHQAGSDSLLTAHVFHKIASDIICWLLVLETFLTIHVFQILTQGTQDLLLTTLVFHILAQGGQDSLLITEVFHILTQGAQDSLFAAQCVFHILSQGAQNSLLATQVFHTLSQEAQDSLLAIQLFHILARGAQDPLLTTHVFDILAQRGENSFLATQVFHILSRGNQDSSLIKQVFHILGQGGQDSCLTTHVFYTLAQGAHRFLPTLFGDFLYRVSPKNDNHNKPNQPNQPVFGITKQTNPSLI